jgi:predicted outer membrane repeat protein
MHRPLIRRPISRQRRRKSHRRISKKRVFAPRYSYLGPELLEPRLLLSGATSDLLALDAPDAVTFYVDDDGPSDPGPGDVSISDPFENGSPDHPFDAIAEAVERASNGDTIVVLPGTYTGKGNRDIDLLGKAITIKSEDPENSDVVAATVIDAEGTEADPHRVFLLSHGEGPDTVFAGLTMQNGYADHGGAIWAHDSTFTLRHSVLSGHEAEGEGGAVYADGETAVEITSSTFTSNRAGNDGGAVALEDSGAVTISDCEFSFNVSGDHGGAGLIRRSSGAVAVSDSSFSDNQALNYGGGLAIADCYDISVTLTNLDLLRNESENGGGGAVRLNYAASLLVVGGTAADNKAGNDGGAFSVDHCPAAALQDMSFLRNESEGSGGALITWGTDLVVQQCRFEENASFYHGGAFFAYHSAVSVVDCLFSGNVSEERDGGAIWANGTGSETVSVNGCSFTNNTAAHDGGGLDLADYETVTLSTCDFANNSSGWSGGSAMVWRSGLSVTDCNFTDGTAGYYGGAFRAVDCGIEVTDTSFIQNQGGRSGGAVNAGGAGTETAVLTRCSFTSNTTLQHGGGLELYDYETVTVSACGFANNESSWSGGSAIVWRSELFVEDCAFENGVAGHNGAAIRAVDCGIEIIDTSFSQNQAGASGGAVNANGTGTEVALLTRCSFTSNITLQHGGATEIYDYETVTLSSCIFSNNESSWGGGGAIVWRSNLIMDGCEWSNNTAQHAGGAVYPVDSSVEITDTTFTENSAAISGGAIQIRDTEELSISGSRFEGNQSSANGGAIDSHNLNSVMISDSQFIGNETTAGSGGALMLSAHDSSVLSGNTFDSNRARYDGGAVYSSSLVFSSTDDRYLNSVAERHVGAVYVLDGDATIIRAEVRGNETAGDVGGIHLHRCDARVSDSVIADNKAVGLGGGLDIFDSTAVVEGSTVEGNSGSWGGGIVVRNYAHANINDSQILANVAETGDGGGIRIEHSLVYLDRNLIADNTSKEGRGGGVDADHCSPMLRNNVLLNNYAAIDGSQMSSYNGSPWLINNVLYVDDPTILPDTALYDTHWSTKPLVVNSVLWQDGPTFSDSNAPHLYYSNTGDGPLFISDGNLTLPPGFVDPAQPLGPDGNWNTGDEGFRLADDSPLVDAGHAAFEDADGSRSDMGAYGNALPTSDLEDIHVSWLNLMGPSDGSSENPYPHIWEAMLAADAGDTIYVHAGYYEENLVFRSEQPNLSVIGDSAAVTHVSGVRHGTAARPTAAWFADGLMVAGLTMRDGDTRYGGGLRIVESDVELHEDAFVDNYGNYSGGGIYVQESSNLLLADSQILRNRSRHGGGLKIDSGCTATIIGNEFANNETTVSWGDGGGLWLGGTVTFSGNVIHHNYARDFGGGVIVYRGDVIGDHNLVYRNEAPRGGGIAVWEGSAELINNTIADNIATDRGGGLGAERQSTVTILNGIYWGNNAPRGEEIFGGSGSELDVDYTTVQDGLAGVLVESDSLLDWGEAVIYADPRFAPAPRDYHLRSTVGRWDPQQNDWVTDADCSPAIDRGMPDPDVLDPADQLEWDWTAEPNPNGQRINMGAYGGTVEASKSCDGDPALPVVVDMEPEPASAEAVSISEINVWFNVDMLPATVENANNWELVGSGGDGVFLDEDPGENTAEDVTWEITRIEYGGAGQPVVLVISDLICGSLRSDVYRLTARDEILSLANVPLDGDFPRDGDVNQLPSGDGTAGGNFVAGFEVTNAPPAAIPDHITVLQDSEDNPLELRGCDPEDAELTFEVLWANPATPGRLEHGWLDDAGDEDTATWEYTPDAGYTGQDQFEFRVSDGQLWSLPAVFEITVIPELCDLQPINFRIADDDYEGECLCPGTPIALTWDGRNNGPGATVENGLEDWTDAVYFSTDDVLDAGDLLLRTSPVQLDTPLGAGQTYPAAVTVTLPNDLSVDGPYYLIVHVDDGNRQLEVTDDNNTAVLPLCVKPFVQMAAPICGMFLEPGMMIDVGWLDAADNVSALVNVVLDTDTDPTNGYTPLVVGADEDADGDGDFMEVEVPELIHGTYQLYAFLTDSEGTMISCPSEPRLVQMFDRVYSVDDPLGDVVAGFPDDYEIHGIEIGISGDRMAFRIRTDFDPRSRGGDVFIEVDDTLSAVAVSNRILPDGRQITAGNLYLDVDALPGEVVPWDYRISDWADELAGYSGIGVIDNVICFNALFALYGWISLPALGAGDSGTISWTMWCGNDHVEIIVPFGIDPPTADAGGDYTVGQGDFVVLDGSGSSDPNQDQETLEYYWDLDGDGVFGEIGLEALQGDERGVNPIFSAVGLAGETVHDIALRVLDTDGFTDLDESTVRVMGLSIDVHASPQSSSVESFSDQDISLQEFAVQDDGSTLRMTGNAWKQVGLAYTITPNTMLEFDFASSQQGEVHAIGFDSDEVVTWDHLFQLYGTEESEAIQAYRDYDASGDPQHFVIPVGQFVSGAMSRLVFVNDDDAMASAESLFTNIQLYEKAVLPDSSSDEIIGRDSATGQWYVSRGTRPSFVNDKWNTWSRDVVWDQVLTGDFNGDGKDDVAGRVATSGSWYVSLSTGNGFVNEKWGAWSSHAAWQYVLVGDFNGDGRDDLAGFVSTTGDWYIARSTGNSFLNEVWTHWSSNVSWLDVQVGDFDGDGRDDLAGRVALSGDWWVAQSSGTGFSNTKWGNWSTAVEWQDVQVGDFNGDHHADIAARDIKSGDWIVAESHGTEFGMAVWGNWSPAQHWVDVQIGDFNGDGRDDLVGRMGGNGSWWVAESRGADFVNANWGEWSPSVDWVDVRVGDFDADGRADIAGRAGDNGDWWVGESTGVAFSNSKWGRWSSSVSWVDLQLGDFNGDGRDDLMARVASSGQWWAAHFDGNAFTTEQWSQWSTNVTWDQVLFGDYNGDGLDDVAGRDAATGDWYVSASTDDGLVTAKWGRWSTIVTWQNVMVGDFNGDGYSDIAGRVSTSGDWWVAQSTGTAFSNAKWDRWPTNTSWLDVQVGDFNGDGNSDIAGRASASGDWWVAESTGSAFNQSNWGRWSLGVDWINVATGDFNGDGSTDLVGQVSTSGSWYVATSTGSAFTNAKWGQWSSAMDWVDINIGDFDGDGLSDLIGRVATSGKWYVATSTGTSFTTANWGLWSPAIAWLDVQIGDFDGDGRSDVAGRVASSGDWWVARSNGDSFTNERWGNWSAAVEWEDVHVGRFGSDEGSNSGDAAAAAADLYWREIGQADDDDDNDASNLLVAEIVDQLLPE